MMKGRLGLVDELFHGDYSQGGHRCLKIGRWNKSTECMNCKNGSI